MGIFDKALGIHHKPMPEMMGGYYTRCAFGQYWGLKPLVALLIIVPNLKVEMQAALLECVQVWKYSGQSRYNNQIYVLPRAEDIR